MFADVVAALVEFLRANPALRKRTAVSSVAVMLVAGSLWVVPSDYLVEEFVDVRSRTFPWFLGVSAILLVACLLSYSSAVRVGSASIDLRPILEERRRIEQRLERSEPDDVFARLELNLNQITEYYAINKSQARNSFRFGVFAIVVGLTVILLGIGTYYLGDQKEPGLAALATVSGSLANFIGASALVLHNRSMSQLNLFFERLSRLQEVMLAVVLSDQVDDAPSRDRLRHQLAVTLVRAR